MDSNASRNSWERWASAMERTTTARPTTSMSNSAPASTPNASIASDGSANDERSSMVVIVLAMSLDSSIPETYVSLSTQNYSLPTCLESFITAAQSVRSNICGNATRNDNQNNPATLSQSRRPAQPPLKVFNPLHPIIQHGTIDHSAGYSVAILRALPKGFLDLQD